MEGGAYPDRLPVQRVCGFRAFPCALWIKVQGSLWGLGFGAWN